MEYETEDLKWRENYKLSVNGMAENMHDFDLLIQFPANNFPPQ